MKIFKDTQAVNADRSRECFTQHGLHMNVSGKEKIARVVSDVNGNILTRKKVELVIPKCKENLVEDRDTADKTMIIRKTL
jgi:capsid protein